MSWARSRLDWFVAEERRAVEPVALGEKVFHYSIPALDEHGDGELQAADEIGSGKLLLRGGEVLVSRLNPRLTRVLIAEAHDVPTVASTEFIALRPGRNVDSRFLWYWLQCEEVRQMLDGATMSVTRSQQRVRPDVLTKMWVCFPQVAAQKGIVRYLDAETARIDALIAKKRRMIELLNERRGAVVTAGVSGRLTGATLGSSPVPWLTQQAVGWSVAKLNFVTTLGSGHTPSRDHPEWWEDCTIPWITTGEVSQMRADRIEYVTETRENISVEGLTNSAAELHPAGTVVLCRTASAGYSAIMGRDMATSQDFATWTCGPLLRPRFLLLCLRAMRQDLLGRLAMGSTHKTIYMPDIESIHVPLPPVGDQDEIVADVWSQLDKLHAVVDGIEAHVAVLAERRQALITAAVTGQLDIAA